MKRVTLSDIGPTGTGDEYHGFASAGWNADRTRCSAVVADAGMTQGEVVTECCQVEESV